MKHVLSLLAVATMLVSCSGKKSNEAPAPSTKSDVGVVGNQVVIKFADGADEESKNKLLAQFAAVEPLNVEKTIYLIKDKTLAGQEDTVAARLSQSNIVEFAEPNFRVSIHKEDIPQDPYFLRLWGLRNFGQDAPNGIEGVEGADIGATKAWATTKGSKEIKVAILDTGCYYKHPDLIENTWVNKAEKEGVPGIDDDKNGYVDDIHGWNAISDDRDRLHFNQVGSPDPLDDNGHGSHVFGTIGATGGNGQGVVGINWHVSVACVKFLSASGSGSTVDEYRGLKYIIANNFDVVNGSYGGGAESKLIKATLTEAGKKGILFVFAAGNDSNNNDATPSWPSSYKLDNIISVAATDSRDQIADFSNFGQNSVHIAAPGVNIISTVPPSADESIPPYAVFSGTSMAAPHVTGAAALLMAADPSFRKNPLKVRERLMATADFKPQLSALVASGGRLNINRAISNDTSGHPITAGKWQEMNYEVATPQHPQKKVDNAWDIKVPGAKAIQVHFSFYQVEQNYDTAVLYDKNYRHSLTLSGEGVDLWSPILIGDTAYLKFSNSMVSIAGGQPFANFNSEGVRIDKVRVLK